MTAQRQRGEAEEVLVHEEDAVQRNAPTRSQHRRLARSDLHVAVRIASDDHPFDLRFTHRSQARQRAASFVRYAAARPTCAVRSPRVSPRRRDWYCVRSLPRARKISRRADGALAFGGDHPAVDWVVAMRRFDESDLVDHLADARRLDASMVRELADEIAAFHA